MLEYVPATQVLHVLEFLAPDQQVWFDTNPSGESFKLLQGWNCFRNGHESRGIHQPTNDP